jgi:methanethiol S-methyltransferase
MSRLLGMAYGIVVYLCFLATFLYAVCFIGNIVVPKTIDSGTPGPLVDALVVNIVLLGIFAVQHSVMARPGFKRWWTRIVPEAVERSTYVLFATAALALLCWQWRPIPDPVIWTVQHPQVILLLHVIFWFGWALLLLSTFLINHFELFGLRQVIGRLLRWDSPKPEFKTPFVYKRVRHPIYLGFMLAFWSTPTMTAGHLLYAVATTGYILIGIYLEERDLVALFGDQYRRYRRQVGMLIPLPGRKYVGDEPLERREAARVPQP